MHAFTIAINTFREALHQRVLLVIFLGSIVLVALIGRLPGFTLTLPDDVKFLKDMTITTATLFGTLAAVFSAVLLITTELEDKTVITILSKPVRRWEYVVGKFLGLVLTLVVLFIAVTIVYTLLVWLGVWSSYIEYRGVYPELLKNYWSEAWHIADEMWRGMVMCLFQVIVLASVAVACCVRAPMIVSVVVYFMTFVAGHFARPLEEAARSTGTVAGTVFAWIAAAVLPDLEGLNVAQEIGVGRLISPEVMALGLLYTVVYSAGMVLLAVVLFRNREVL
jgi:hypothetical protein